MTWNATLNGNTYGPSNLEGVNYANNAPGTGFGPMMQDAALHVAGAWKGTSGDSLTINPGPQPLTVAGHGFAVGQPVRIRATADATAKTYMQGTVTAYDEETGAMTVDVESTGGGGTYTSWSVFVMLSELSAPSSPVTEAEGGLAASTWAQGRINLQVPRMAQILGAVTVLPGSPSAGDTYLLIDGGGNTDQFAVWDGAAWAYQAAVSGDRAYDTAQAVEYRYTGVPGAYGAIALGSAWVHVTASPPADVPIAIASTGTLALDPQASHTVARIASGIVLSLPAASGYVGHTVSIVLIDGSGSSTINVLGGGSLSGASSRDLTVEHEALTAVADAAQWRVISRFVP